MTTFCLSLYDIFTLCRKPSQNTLESEKSTTGTVRKFCYTRDLFLALIFLFLCPPCLGIRSRRRGCARAASPRSRSDGGWWCWAAAADRSAWSRTGTQCAACGQRVVCKRSSISLKSSNYSYGNIKKIVYSLLQANKAISRVAVLIWKKQSGDILSIKFKMGWF